MFEIIDTKKRIARVCFGVVIYMAALMLAQYSFYYGTLLVESCIPHAEYYVEMYDVIDGVSALASIAFACLILWFFASWFHGRGLLFDERPLQKVFFSGNRKIRIRTFFIFVALLVVLQFGCSILLQLFEIFLNRFDLTVMNSPAMNADYTLSPFLLAYALVFGPFAEELVFRGFILKGLRPYGKKFAIFVSAFLFSMMHGDIQQLLFTFLAGIILAYLACEYSIWISYALHVVNNGLLSELVMYLEKILPEEVFSLLYLVMIILSFILLLIWFFRKRRCIISYIRNDHTAVGARMGLCNLWFIIFVLYGAAETILTISSV